MKHNRLVLIAALFLLGFGVTSAFAQGFAPGVILSSDVISAFGVCAADFDGDGDIDVAASGSMDGTLQWLERATTDLRLTPHLILTTGSGGLRDLCVGEFTHDGRPDLIAAMYAQDRFILLRNTGAITEFFDVEEFWSQSNGAFTPYAGDMDGDGDLDVVTAEYGGNVVRIFRQDADGFHLVAASLIPSPMDVRFFDYDNDGVMDVIGASETGTLFWIKQFTTESWHPAMLSAGAYCTSVGAGDFDRDGSMDLVSAPFDDNQVYIWEQTPNGLAPHALPGALTHVRDVKVADFNYDGFLDIAASSQDGFVRWWQGSASGAFTMRTISAGGVAYYRLCVVDFDQDGDLDLLGADAGTGSIYYFNNTMGTPAYVAGYVRAALDNAPLQGVGVHLLPIGTSTLTNAEGYYRLGCAPGTYTLSFGARCWNPDTVTSVVIALSETTRVDQGLTRPMVSIDVSSLNLTAPNRQITRTALPLRNTGDGPMSVSVRTNGAHLNDGWLRVTPADTVIAGGEEMVFAVEIEPDTTDTLRWDYYGAITLRTNACPDSVVRVAVVAFVLDGPKGEFPLPAHTELLPAYPNPFNSGTFVSYELERAAHTELVLYNTLGLEVRRMSGPGTPGVHRVRIDAGTLSSGVYLLQARLGERTFSQKLLLIR